MPDQRETMILLEVEETVTEVDWSSSQPRSVTVNVIIDDDSGQGAFHLESAAGGLPIAQGFILQFDNNQGGVYSKGFTVNFALPDDQGKNANWTFDDDAIWAKLVNNHGTCPRNKSENDPAILQNPTLSADKRTLTVTNANAKAEYFGFALRFKSTVGGKTLAYDPIGDNRNGGSPIV